MAHFEPSGTVGPVITTLASMPSTDETVRHQCMIYDGAPSVSLDVIVRILIAKLSAGHCCIYLNSPPMVAGLRSRLAAAGLDPVEATARGHLVASSDQSHLKNGLFDPDAMIAMLAIRLREALSDGYRGLWASGDMAWELGHERNFRKLLDYERKLDTFLRENPQLSGICQYHRSSLPAESLAIALETHEALYVNATLSRLNPFYGDRDLQTISADELLDNAQELLFRESC